MHILDIFTIDMRHVRTRVRMLLLLLLLLLGCCCCCHCKRTADTEIYKHIYIYTHTHTPTHTYYIYIHTHIYQCCDSTYFSFKIPRSAAISEADKIDACFTRCCMITAPGASPGASPDASPAASPEAAAPVQACHHLAVLHYSTMPSLGCSPLLYDTT